MNSWAKKETKGLVKNLLPPESVDSSTRIVLANALYFKGAWKKEFDDSLTKDYDFHLLNGSSVKAPFMMNRKKQLLEANDGFKVLGLRYEHGIDRKRRFTM